MSKKKKPTKPKRDSNGNYLKEFLPSRRGKPYESEANPFYAEIAEWRGEKVSYREIRRRLSEPPFNTTLGHTSIHGWVQRKAKASQSPPPLYVLPPLRRAKHSSSGTTAPTAPKPQTPTTPPPPPTSGSSWDFQFGPEDTV